MLEVRIGARSKGICMFGMRVASATISLLISPAVVAQKQTIRCDVKASGTVAGETQASDDVSFRYYQLDDASKSITILVDGVPKPACSASCDVHYGTDAITLDSEYVDGAIITRSSLVIDRIEGKLQDHMVVSRGGRAFMQILVSGACRTVTLARRKF